MRSASAATAQRQEPPSGTGLRRLPPPQFEDRGHVMAATTVRPHEDPGQGAPTVSLVDVDPDLTSGIPEDDADLARRVLTRPRYDIPKGRWSPELLRGHAAGAFA